MIPRLFSRNSWLVQFCLFGLWTLPLGALAQADPNPQVAFPPAPNAAVLGEYGAIPVSNYVGLPTIAVPLHSIVTKSNRVDISLSYRASGIRVEEEASWVGLGWSLNVGGVVTRSMQGLDDLSTYGYAMNGAMPPWDANNNYNPAGRDLDVDRSYFTSVCSSYQDTQPDFFYYNFGNHSGKFVLEKGSTLGQFSVRLIDNADNSSIVYKTLPGTSSPGWAIVTQDGYTYNFGSTERTTVYPGGNQTRPLHNYISAWYLTEIIAPDGERVTFAYDTNYTSSLESRSSTRAVYFDETNNSVPPGPAGSCGTTYYRRGDVQGYPTQATKTSSWTNGKIIKSITYATGSVSFSHSDREDIEGRSGTKSQRITDFQVVSTPSTTSQSTKTVFFRQSYFNPSGTDINTGVYAPYKLKRLKLDAIGQSNQGLTIPDYVFTYYSGNLPAKDSYNKDFLGYYNAASNDALGTDIPTMTTPLVSNPSLVATLNLPGGAAADRNPNESATKYGTLKEIQYPTGGKTAFDYQLQDYRDNTNVFHTGCGLRILRVTSTDNVTGNQTLKKYAYTLAGTSVSSGRRMSPESYIYFGADKVNYPCGTLIHYYSIRSSSSRLALSNSAQGQPYGYDVVTVLEGENGENGKTEYSYTNVEDQVPTVNFFTSVPNQINVANGNLLRETVYKKSKSSSSFEKVAETINDYATGSLANGDLRLIKGCIVSKDEFCAQSSFANSWAPGIKYYDIQSYWSRLTSTIKRIYNQNNQSIYIQTTTVSQYNSSLHRQATMTAETLPTGEVLREYRKYPSDYTTLTSGPVFDMANSLRVLNAPVETYNTVVRNGVEQLTGGKFVTYNYAKSGNLLVGPTQVDQLRLSAPVAFSGFAPSTPALQKDARYAPVNYLVYNQATGNPDVTRNADDIPTSYQWGYGNSLAVAQFVNADRTAPDANAPALGNEASYLGFEAGQTSNQDPAADYWSNVGINRDVNYVVPEAHTGTYAFRVGEATPNRMVPGPSRTFWPAQRLGRYKLSAWVKTESATFAANAGQLSLQVLRANGNAVPNAAPQVLFGDTQGAWTYVEVTVDLGAVQQQLGLSASPEALQVMASISNLGGSSGNPVGYFVDDVRFQPALSQVTTYTYDAATRQPTSISDANNRPTYYQYDAFQRLQAVRDHLNQLVKHYTYHFQR